MQTFTEPEFRLIRKLKGQPPQAVLQIKEPCLTHSVCNPLPVFRVYKIDDTSFEAQWNGYHQAGTKQVFRFEEAGQKTQKHKRDKNTKKRREQKTIDRAFTFDFLRLVS